MQEIKTKNAPDPLGPYSQAVIVDNTVYVAMQLPVTLDAADPAIDSSASIEQQTRQVLDNIKAVLEASGTSINRSVRVTVYLTDLVDGKIVNPIYAEYFNGILPARSIVNVCSLPFDYKIAVDVTAVLP